MWANDLLVGSEMSWWFPNILPLESGLIGMAPKNPATRARINRNGSHSSGYEISCDTGLSSSSPAGSRSGIGVWCWMLASWGCVRSSPTSSAVSAWPLVPVPLAPTDLHFGSSLAIGFCRCASDRYWRMSGSFVASSVLSAMSHIRKAGLTSHWSWRCGVWFSCWFLQMPRCFWAWQKLRLPCRFWLWRLGLCLPDGQPHFPGRRRTPLPLWALHQLWLVRWQLSSSSSAQSSFCWSWALCCGCDCLVVLVFELCKRCGVGL